MCAKFWASCEIAQHKKNKNFWYVLEKEKINTQINS